MLLWRRASGHPDPDGPLLTAGRPAAGWGGALASALFLFLAVSAGAELPLKPERHLRFETNRGTWMSLDRTADGRTIVFDLLGDLYAAPSSGGKGRAISRGLAFDTQPAVSPDGRSIAFVSDRSGSDNLWIARIDGSGQRQISFNDDETMMVSPAWSADGRALFVSRYRPDLNHYELWRYPLQGTAELLIPIRDRDDGPRSAWRSSLGAAASPDGGSLYFARRVGEIDFDKVQEWTIVRRDLATGEETVVVAEPDGPRKPRNPGAFFRPALSPDGRWLAYGARREGRTELRLRELATGLDRTLAFPVEHDQLQASMWQDILPRYAFTPDSKAILLSREGRIERLSLASGKVSDVPFRAAVDLAVGPSTRQAIREMDSGPVRARLAQSPVPSPDGARVAFSALGRLYLQRLDGSSATPLGLPPEALPAFQPSWSPDGKMLTFVSWSEAAGGAIWIIPSSGTAQPRRMTSAAAFYTYPTFDPVGRSLVAVRSPQEARLRLYMEYGKLRDAELVSLPLAGGEPRTLIKGRIGGRPQFTSDRSAAFILTGDGLARVVLASGTQSVAAKMIGPGWYFQDGPQPVDDLRISPDGKWLAGQIAHQLHLAPMPPRPGATINLLDGAGHWRITRGGADFFEWSADGQRIFWSSGARLVSQPVAEILKGQPARIPASETRADSRQWRLDVSVPRPASPCPLLLSGARILTMAAGAPVIERGDVLVEDGRFRAVGASGSFAVPPAVKVIDVTGKTIIPGLIDTHDHIATVRREVLGLDDWGLRARLAYGITTSFDPSTLSIDMLAYQDLLDAGLMTGPRLRSTGPAIFSFYRFRSLDEVRAVLRRYRDDYRLANIKQYRSGNRRVRQWIAQAARELGLHPTTEGALAMKLDLTQIIDGYAGQEHALVAAPLQKDVMELLRAMRPSYTTTLEITNGGFEGQDWSIVRDDPAKEARLRRFWPQFAIDQMFLSREWRPLGEYRFPAIAADAARLQRDGGLVGMGSHGEAPGLGYHWEMEAHLAGGMTPLEVLHAATIGSAETIGRAADLGSIEPGKLADLVVLDGDPRDDLRKARAVGAVMRDGRLYDGETLAPIWPEGAAPPRPWFADPARRWLPLSAPPASIAPILDH